MNLKDFHGNLVEPLTLLYLPCGRCGKHQIVSRSHAQWSFTLEPTNQKDDKNYLIVGLKITAVATQTTDNYNFILWWYIVVTTTSNKLGMLLYSFP